MSCPRCRGFIAYDYDPRLAPTVYCVNCGWRPGRREPIEAEINRGLEPQHQIKNRQAESWYQQNRERVLVQKKEYWRRKRND